MAAFRYPPARAEIAEGAVHRALPRGSGDAWRARDLPAADVQMIAHRPVGLAGTFGLHDLGEAARTLDQRIAQAQPDAAELDLLKRQLSLI